MKPHDPLSKSALYIICFFTLFISQSGFAQVSQSKDTLEHINMPTLEVRTPAKELPRNYRGSATRVNDLTNTRLAVRFDFKKCYLYGKEWITLKPHFYPTDSLTLDAKGMSIHEIALISGKRKIPLKYYYNGMQLHVRLGKVYTRHEPYTLYISYTSKPNEYAAKKPGGSEAVTADKGLYFINPHHTNPYKPTEVWTMGYPESNSAWFPTIDKPDQKTMEEISMTVPDSMTTLSNGLLISRKKNDDGTRTDTWKMMHPNSPYLFTMAAGPFVAVKDHWKNMPVNYYVEKEYARYAKEIFGHTPTMIGFYSKILGVPYPWKKYDQIVTRDFVTGAMENTSATMHGEFMFKTARQMNDFNFRNESVIAHELFHQWFGDLVTNESWSNITLNESFADYGETLWAAHEYGNDLAGQHHYRDMQTYFNFAKSHDDHPLVDFYYHDKADLLDAVSYQKGGCILVMLRNYVGDSAFFHSLHYYLDKHKFHPAEAQQLRLAFEHVTGEDLNWFWNEWYYGKGYPRLDISYDYNDALHLVHVIVKQKQHGRVFELPFAIDVYTNGKRERHKVMMMDRADTFTYHYVTKPDLINVDGDKVLLAEINDHKTIQNYIYQYHHAGLYLDRLEAIQACAKVQDSNQAALALLINALRNKFYGIRNIAIDSLHLKNEHILRMTKPLLLRIISSDPYSSVRSKALAALTNQHPDAYKNIIMKALADSSLLVENTALDILEGMDEDAAYQQAKAFEKNAEAPLTATVCRVLSGKHNPADFAYIKKNFEEHGSFTKFEYLYPFISMLSYAITDDRQVKKGLDQVKDFAENVGSRYSVYAISMLNNFVRAKRAVADKTANAQIKSKLNGQADYAKKLISELQEKLAR